MWRPHPVAAFRQRICGFPARIAGCHEDIEWFFAFHQPNPSRSRHRLLASRLGLLFGSNFYRSLQLPTRRKNIAAAWPPDKGRNARVNQDPVKFEDTPRVGRLVRRFGPGSTRSD